MSVALISPRQRRSSRRMTRRAFLAGGVGSLSWATLRRDSMSQQAASPVVPTEGTPVASPVGDAGSGRWQGRSLRVGAWGGEVQDALRAVIWQPFAASTGCDVQEVLTDYNRLPAAQRPGAAYADLLVVDPIWATAALDQDRVEQIPGDTIDRATIGPMAATEGSVPAYAYAMVSAFRRDAVVRGDAPGDWAAWWDSGQYAGRRALPHRALTTFEMALMADGVPADQLYPLDLDRAIASLKRVSAQIEDRWWADGLEPVMWLSRNRTDFAAAWHYRIVAGQRDGRDIDFVWNQGLLVADHWVVPKGAPNRDVALDLIRFAYSPEVQAGLARAIPLGPIAPAAFEFLNAAEARDLPTAPESVEHLVPLDPRWWAEHQQEANHVFAEWLAEDKSDE